MNVYYDDFIAGTALFLRELQFTVTPNTNAPAGLPVRQPPRTEPYIDKVHTDEGSIVSGTYP